LIVGVTGILDDTDPDEVETHEGELPSKIGPKKTDLRSLQSLP
jgi:hypothetical protein